MGISEVGMLSCSGSVFWGVFSVQLEEGFQLSSRRVRGYVWSWVAVVYVQLFWERGFHFIVKKIVKWIPLGLCGHQCRGVAVMYGQPSLERNFHVISKKIPNWDPVRFMGITAAKSWDPVMYGQPLE